MKRKLILPLFGLLLLCSCAEKGEYSDWRGPKRDGIYPETGLLKQWPEEGPALLWSYEELGFGHTAVAVSDDKVYLTGIKDSANSLGGLGSREHWARPVIHQGVLYIRHGEALMAYDIKDPKINID